MRKLIVVNLVITFLPLALLGFMTFSPPPVFCSVLMTAGYDNAEDFQEQQQPPVGDDPNEPPPVTHQKPTMACTQHNRPDGKMPCMCVKQSPEGCQKGKRVIEHNSCNSWCWKELCRCCGS